MTDTAAKRLNLRVIRTSLDAALLHVGSDASQARRALESARTLLDQARRRATDRGILHEIEALERTLAARTISRHEDRLGD